jgi:hypothetical protein
MSSFPVNPQFTGGHPDIFTLSCYLLITFLENNLPPSQMSLPVLGDATGKRKAETLSFLVLDRGKAGSWVTLLLCDLHLPCICIQGSLQDGIGGLRHFRWPLVLMSLGCDGWGHCLLFMIVECPTHKACGWGSPHAYRGHFFFLFPCPVDVLNALGH